jgi:hypothetical protein
MGLTRHTAGTESHLFHQKSVPSLTEFQVHLEQVSSFWLHFWEAVSSKTQIAVNLLSDCLKVNLTIRWTMLKNNIIN